MTYNLSDENSPAYKLITGKITTSEFMETQIKLGRKPKRAFEEAERLLYDRGNRMPNLNPKK